MVGFLTGPSSSPCSSSVGVVSSPLTPYPSPHPPPRPHQALLAAVNQAVDRVGSMVDWQLLEFKDGMKAFKSPGLDVPAWRKDAEQRAERAFAWLEARADGRLPLPPPQGQGQSQRR